MASKIALVAMVIILGAVNWSIAGKENHLAEGKIVYLELAPVDPRSLMQGDYMALNFRVATAVYDALPKADKSRRWRQKVEATDGYVIVSVNEQNIGTFKGLYENKPLSNNDVLMRYRVRNGKIKFATNAYFFQEGHGKYYESAQYGLFRVDNEGELLLASMHNKDLEKIEADTSGLNSTDAK